MTEGIAVDLELANIAAVEEQVAKLSKDVQLGSATLIAVAKIAMEVVEQVTTMDGAQKKRLVLQVLRRMVEKAPFQDAAERQLCLTLIDTGIVESAIKLAIDASKGIISVNIPMSTGGCKGCILF